MKHIFIYVTVPTQNEAEKIAQVLVEEKLAACANIIAGMTSLYRWQGKIERAQEAVLILKTRENLFAAVEARVRELHSYDTPCIVALPLVAGNKDYLRWIESALLP